MGIYCTANEQVRANTGFINQYSSSQTPTLVEVNYFIDQVENEINLAISSIGLTIPVTNTYLLGTLERYSAIGAAGMVLRRFGKDDEQTKANRYLEDYEKFINKLVDDKNYQNMLIGIGSNYKTGNLAGTAVTEGFVTPTTLMTTYGVDNFII